MQIKVSSLSRVLAVAAILSGIMGPANAQTYTSFDALSNGTFPTEMDSSSRILGTPGSPGIRLPSQVFIRNTDGSITLINAPASDWAGFSGTANIVGRY